MATQFAFNFDGPRFPSPDSLYQRGTQKHRLYSRLLEGPFSNVQIVHDLCIMNSTGRISEIREDLKPYLVDVICEKGHGNGVFIYRLK